MIRFFSSYLASMLAFSYLDQILIISVYLWSRMVSTLYLFCPLLFYQPGYIYNISFLYIFFSVIMLTYFMFSFFNLFESDIDSHFSICTLNWVLQQPEMLPFLPTYYANQCLEIFRDVMVLVSFLLLIGE